MTLLAFLLILHILGAVTWVGGMAFSILVLRPSLAVLEPAQRLDLHARVFKRFFLIVWHAMPIMILTGFGMVGLYGGFAAVHWNVHVMLLTGVIMAAVFVLMFFGPWKRMRAAMATSDHPAAASAADSIRKLVTANLVLGTITIIVAAWEG